jgi:hypothetical protein
VFDCIIESLSFKLSKRINDVPIVGLFEIFEKIRKKFKKIQENSRFCHILFNLTI